MSLSVVTDELDFLLSMVNIGHRKKIIELGCGAADLSRRLVESHLGSEVVGVEVDERQHTKNMLNPAQGLHFVRAGAQNIPFDHEQFDLALMLKSLHHVPLNEMGQALTEIHRVLRPTGLLYISEPVFAGALNEVMRLFHDEEEVRAAAIRAIEQAVLSGTWEQVTEKFFDVPVHYRDFEDFQKRLIDVTYVTHRLDQSTLQRVRDRFEPHMTSGGAHFMRPMRVNLLLKL